MNVAIAGREERRITTDDYPRISPTEDDAPRERDRVVALIGRDSEVLELQSGTESIAPDLRARGCRVVSVLCDGAGAAVVPGGLALARLDDGGAGNETNSAGGPHFDVVVALDLLQRLHDPESVLALAANVLKPAGVLIASVPNAAHGSVRLALLGGHSPLDGGGVLDRTHLRFFTRDSLTDLLENAGFVVGHVGVIEAPFADRTRHAVYHDKTLPGEWAEALARDTTARASRYIVTAQRLPSPEFQWVRRWLRKLAEEKESAVREALELRQLLDSSNAHLSSLTQIANRELETRRRLRQVHEELARRDEEFRAGVRELVQEVEVRAGVRFLVRQFLARLFEKALAVANYGKR